jgi:ankyrin repeat protein
MPTSRFPHVPVPCAAFHSVSMVLQESATPLYCAAQKGQVEVVSQLLDAGAAVNINFNVSPSLPLWLIGAAGSTGCTTFCSYIFDGRLRTHCTANLLCCVVMCCL